MSDPQDCGLGARAKPGPPYPQSRVPAFLGNSLKLVVCPGRTGSGLHGMETLSEIGRVQ